MRDLDEVEDKVHFLNQCTAYEDDRRELFKNVGRTTARGFGHRYFCVVNAKDRKRGGGSHRKVYIQEFSSLQENPLRQSSLLSVYRWTIDMQMYFESV